ncbi:MAG: GTP-binding protein [Promethearchaeota archaeon]
MSKVKVKDVFKILVLGAPGVGKTTLIENYSDKPFRKDIAAKVGVNFFIKQVNIDGQNYNLQFWDFFDEDKFGFLRKSFYKGASAIFFVFDLSKPETFDNYQRYLKEAWNEGNLNKCPVLLIGNKLDLVKNPETINRQKYREFVEKEGLLGYIELNSTNNIDPLMKGIPLIIQTNLGKNFQVKFLVNKREKEEIKRFAKLSHQKQSDFIRTAIWEKIKSMKIQLMIKNSKDNKETEELRLEELKKIRELLEKL